MERQSPWTAAAPMPDRPALQGQQRVDVAVVGGGIAGLTTALLAQRDGAAVAVVEGERIASGTTGGTTGKVTSQHGVIYESLVQRHGENKARLYGEANQAGVALVRDLVAELGIDCSFGDAPAYVYTLAPESRPELETEAQTAQRLGLPATFTTDMEFPDGVVGAVRFANQAYLNAASYAQGLADEIVRGGGSVFEHSRVVDIEWMRDPVVVHSGDGEVTADHVVVATLLPILDVGGFFAKARPKRSYGIAGRLPGPAPRDMAITLESPKRSTRPWPAAGPNGIVIVGDGHETGSEEQTDYHFAALEEWAQMYFGGIDVEHRWSAQDYSTFDNLPFVGRSPRTSNCYVATGFDKWGLSNAGAAAVMLTDLMAGRENPWLEAFDATRLADAAGVAKLVKDNVEVGKYFVGDRLGRLRADAVADLQPGAGGVVRSDGKAVAAYRDPDGRVHAVDATCTHMGCTVHFNSAETSWDCPCHGSRFATDGSVIVGPAVKALEQVEVAEDEV